MQKTSKDAYLIQEGNTFKIGTSKVEKTLELGERGAFTMTGYTNKVTGSQYLSGKQRSDEFALTFNGKVYAGSDGGWQVVGVTAQTLSQDELEAIITLKNDVLQVERHYVAYPGVGVIQEWTVYENISGADAKIDRPRIFVNRMMADQVDNCDFGYMTGAANFSGSTIFKTVPVSDGI
ncbi:MAG TPA: hypothetical protein VK880_06080, partial [Anaerolineales bacterium]|nr:hypothetical protein [Anaerolineales bacterium]